MAEYHGDIMYKMGNIYTRADDRNYLVAIILAFLFGVIGLHRFYLGDLKIAYFYFFPFAITAIMGVVMFDFTFLLIFCAIASLAVFCEIIYFVVCWARRSGTD